MLQGEFDLGIGRPSPGPWRPERPERLFFGVLLETDTAFHAEQCRRSFCEEHHVEGTPRGRKRLHISLHSAGDHTHLPARIIYAAKLVGKAISMSPIEVTLHSITSFERKRNPHKRPLVLLAESAALGELHTTLGAEMRKIGLRTRKHFTPHVTLLYGPNAVPRQAIEPIRFVVREFSLIHSELGLSRYNMIARWPLCGC